MRVELRAKINRMGLRTDPCIRPVVGNLVSDRVPRYLIWKDLLVR